VIYINRGGNFYAWSATASIIVGYLVTERFMAIACTERNAVHKYLMGMRYPNPASKKKPPRI
jgi:hypothetical protein